MSSTEPLETSTSVSEAHARIGDFVRSSLQRPDLRDDDDIFVVGEATSLYSMELVLFIEEQLGVILGDDDLSWSNFETISNMGRMVQAKLEAR